MHLLHIHSLNPLVICRVKTTIFFVSFHLRLHKTHVHPLDLEIKQVAHELSADLFRFKLTT